MKRQRLNYRPNAFEQPRDGNKSIVAVVAAVAAVAVAGRGVDVVVMNHRILVVVVAVVALGKTYPAAVVAVEPLGVHLVVAAAVATMRPIRTTNADQRSFPFLVEIDADDDDSLIKTLNKDKEMK